MSAGHNGSSSPNGTPSLRAVDPLRAESPHLDNGLNAAARNDCTIQSERASQAYRDWNAVPGSSRPLSTSHETLHKAFDSMLHAHWMKGDGAYTNEALGRACGIDEKGVRQWRDGAKRIPLAALMVLPPTIAVELVQWVSERRGLGRQQRSVAVLADVVKRVESTPVPADEREETLRALGDAVARIQARIMVLATGGT